MRERLQRHMIYHHPLPLPRERHSGSMVRICRMIEAFRNIGYSVHVLAGYASERNEAVKKIKAFARDGIKYDFLYSESSTAPTLLAKRNIGRPFLEIDLFRWCKKNSTPVGLYYRDIHWRFDQYKSVTTWGRRAVATPLYWFDWLQYLSLVDCLFLPSIEMVKYLPPGWRNEWIHALPPGCDIKDNNSSKDAAPGEALSLIYVGGVRPPLYNLTPLFESISRSSAATVTLCCRLAEWNEVKDFYHIMPNGKIKIVHEDSQALEPYYLQSDAFLLAWDPNLYLSFAMPVKVFEALGYGLPLISIAGTMAADFISQENIGWVVTNAEELVGLYEYLVHHPEDIIEKKRNVERVRSQHTWEVRAKQAADLLTQE